MISSMLKFRLAKLPWQLDVEMRGVELIFDSLTG
jgi:hypothetical protein